MPIDKDLIPKKLQIPLASQSPIVYITLKKDQRGCQLYSMQHVKTVL